MNDGGSITEFFYNVVPGFYFLTLLLYFLQINPTTISNDFIKNDAVSVILILLLCLLLGFIFQAITILIRHHLGWNNRSFQKIMFKNGKENVLFKSTFRNIKKELTIDNETNVFFLMDAKLRAEKRAFLPTHFSSLFAFWSNIFCAGMLIILIVLVRELCVPSFSSEKTAAMIFLFMFTILSWYLADKFLFSFYDTVLNSYVMTYIKSESKTK